jgi:hypothetical protein
VNDRPPDMPVWVVVLGFVLLLVGMIYGAVR